MSEPSISGHHITVTIDSLLCDGVTRLSLIRNIIFPVFCTLLSCYALESWFAVNLRLLLWRAACICLAHYPCKGQHMQRKSWWQETRTALMVFLTTKVKPPFCINYSPLILFTGFWSFARKELHNRHNILISLGLELS